MLDIDWYSVKFTSENSVLGLQLNNQMSMTITAVKSEKKVFTLVRKVYKNFIEKVKLELDLEDQIKK